MNHNLVFALALGGLFAFTPQTVSGQTGIYVLSGVEEARFSGTVNVMTSHIFINSKDSEAFNAFGNSEVVAMSANVVGGTANPDNFVGQLNDNTHSPVADPLAHLPLPTWDPASDLGGVDLTGGTVTLSPGFYSGGITLASNARVNLLPGLYILGGAGLDMTAQSEIYGIDVTLFITGTGKVDMAGSGRVMLAPQNDGVYDDVLLFVDRRTGGTVDILGGANFIAHGQMYAPASRVNIGGNGGAGGDPKMGFLLVCDELDLSGTGTVTFIRFPSPEDCYD